MQAEEAVCDELWRVEEIERNCIGRAIKRTATIHHSSPNMQNSQDNSSRDIYKIRTHCFNFSEDAAGGMRPVDHTLDNLG